MAPRRPAELYRAPFPLYTVRFHPRRALAITAGGGGAAKTGIRNGVHFLQLEQIGGQLSASLLHSHDTETRATMTMALADDIIAAGQDADCHILRFSLQAPEARRGSDGRNGSGEKGPRRRKGPSPMGQGDTQSQSSEVTVESLHSVRTDFSPDALQKAVRFNADCSLLVTGGADGFLRLWEFPSMKKTLEFKAHDGEIEDIALGPDNKVVTAGRDFQCCVWQQDQLVTGLRWNENLPGIPDKAYRYQACRFGAVEDNAGALRLYTVQVPHKRERRPPPCYLTKWDGKSFLPLLTRPCGTEVVSCLSIRLPSRLAAAAALRWAHRGRHPAAAARLPWLPLAPQPPPARTDPPGLPLPCLGPPQQTVKQTRDQPGHGRGADWGGWEPLGGAQPEGTVLAAAWGWPQGGGRPAGPLPHGDH
ncbi:prolactin regulatory element-binding protein isoform X1 [Rissa tridactyla]|uniref:prolactin regulatory element-binding protein isoform X1 n=1 Tax=Rissa tridactyla TaxID=75485 RepID=UPI0023BB108B|nr:prolactin regulatory element-binding protein isoform X1 [Rissa tridactyla]